MGGSSTAVDSCTAPPNVVVLPNVDAGRSALAPKPPKPPLLATPAKPPPPPLPQLQPPPPLAAAAPKSPLPAAEIDEKEMPLLPQLHALVVVVGGSLPSATRFESGSSPPSAERLAEVAPASLIFYGKGFGKKLDPASGSLFGPAFGALVAMLQATRKEADPFIQRNPANGKKLNHVLCSPADPYQPMSKVYGNFWESPTPNRGIRPGYEYVPPTTLRSKLYPKQDPHVDDLSATPWIPGTSKWLPVSKNTGSFYATKNLSPNDKALLFDRQPAAVCPEQYRAGGWEVGLVRAAAIMLVRSSASRWPSAPSHPAQPVYGCCLCPSHPLFSPHLTPSVVCSALAQRRIAA